MGRKGHCRGRVHLGTLVKHLLPRSAAAIKLQLKTHDKSSFLMLQGLVKKALSHPGIIQLLHVAATAHWVCQGTAHAGQDSCATASWRLGAFFGGLPFSGRRCVPSSTVMKRG